MNHERAFGLERSSTTDESYATKLSEVIFGIKWKNYFPLPLSETESIELTTYQAASQFLEEHYSTIYNASHRKSPFVADELTHAKRNYYHLAGDCFAFKHQNITTGIFIGTPIDWSSYYFRHCSILPAYQGGRRYQRLLVHLLEILQLHGVERVEGDIAPSNLAHIHVLNKLLFNINGILLSERWGSLLHFTRHLSKKHEDVFLNQFCHGVAPQLMAR